MRWTLLLCACVLAACSQSQSASNDRFNVQPGSIPRAAFASTDQPPPTGQFEIATAPDGRKTSVWVPIGSFHMPRNFEEQAGGRAVQPFNVPKIDEPYTEKLGRYETVRKLDGSLEFTWKANEPASPVQGYWQERSNREREWIAGMTGTASDR